MLRRGRLLSLATYLIDPGVDLARWQQAFAQKKVVGDVGVAQQQELGHDFLREILTR